jgi:hypothetical protein
MSKLFIPAALMLCAASALAQHDAPLTRAEVRSELAAARAEGTLLAPGEVQHVDDHFLSQKTRGAVRAEVAHARAEHTLPAIGEGMPRWTDLNAPSTRSREDVRSEARSEARDAARSRHIDELYID